MQLIKLSATDSTNSYLKSLSTTISVEDFTVIFAKNQTKGRGQMGAVWKSKPGLNLTISVFKDLSGYNLESYFYVSMVTSLAILKTLEALLIPKLSIKWPNDILSADKKICGILIENVIKKNQINASIIGIGLNVNQTVFDRLFKASSLKILSGKEYDLDALTISMVNHLKVYFSLLKKGNYDLLKADYESYLFRKNKPSTFVGKDQTTFSGFIKGVSNSGHLQILLEDNILKTFSLKEVMLLY